MRDTLAVGEPLFIEEVHVYISPTDVSLKERRVLSYGQGVGCNSCVQGTQPASVEIRNKIFFKWLIRKFFICEPGL